MKITKKQYRRIAMCLLPARGNVRLSNLAVLNVILYVLENGCKWRSLPKSYGPWHTIYTRMNRWAKSGVLDRAFEKLCEENLLDLPEVMLSMDSTSIKVHSDGTGALKKPVPNLSESPEEEGQPKYIWLPRVTARQ